MAQFEQKASLETSSYNPLPFRSRKPDNAGSQHVSWAAPTDSGQVHKSQVVRSYSPADKENVKSWLDSTSPTSVLQSNVQTGGMPFDPPTPSPVCSPSPSSHLASPSMSIAEREQTDTASLHHTTHGISSTETNAQSELASGKKAEASPSTSAREEKVVATEAPPDSPTGSAFSSGSEGGLLALLASKLLSYKENGRGFSRYAKESSGPIDEKHIMEDRSKKPPVEDITTIQSPPPWSPTNANGLHRTLSEAASEYSLGSAYDRTLSMEFDSMLAAAVATGIRQALVLPDQQLPDIEEDASNVGAHQPNDVGSGSLLRDGDARRVSSDDEASRLISALTVMRQGRESEDMDFRSTLSEIPLSSRSSINSSSRRGNIEDNSSMENAIPPTAMASIESRDGIGYSTTTMNRDVSLRRSSSASKYGEHSLAMVLHDHTATRDQASRTATDPKEPILSSASSSSVRMNLNPASVIPLPSKEALEKVKKDKIHAQALAFQDAESSKFSNRYFREESKIAAWENQQKINASLRLKKVEMKLEQKKAKAVEKMENEIARAHKRAEERKASAEAVRAVKTAKVMQMADSIRRNGSSPPTRSVGCFSF